MPNPEIKDHMDREVQVEIEEGLISISHAGGKLKLHAEDWITLVDAGNQLGPHVKFKSKPGDLPEAPTSREKLPEIEGGVTDAGLNVKRPNPMMRLDDE